MALINSYVLSIFHCIGGVTVRPHVEVKHSNGPHFTQTTPTSNGGLFNLKWSVSLV